jgi:hypothetical protein
MRRFTFVPVALLACACGPDSLGETPRDASGPVDASTDGTTPIETESDAQPMPFTIYAHSKNTLYTVDDKFALATIGLFDNGGDSITDLAVAADGALFGVSKTKLYSIDAKMGKATFIAGVTGMTNVALTFLAEGQLVAADSEGGVREINPKTGAVREIGAYGGGYATAGDLVAVEDGTLYTISDKGPVGDEAANNWLLTVDPKTGNYTKAIGQIKYGKVWGAAYTHGHVYAFTMDGKIIEIDRETGVGTEVAHHPVEFWGAGVTPLVPLIE